MPIDTQELMKQVGRIRVVTSRLVDEHLSGDYHSVFKGRGIEFDEVRAYGYGDDVRAIDWNVTARMGRPFVKRFAEERELTILFVVDVSGSQAFGSGRRSKAETAAEITCLLALSAIRNQDKVGLILFSDRIETYLPARKGRTAVMRLVREVLAAEETRRGTDLTATLRFLNTVQKRKAVVFLISDFMTDGYQRDLRVTAARHDVIGCAIRDPREEALIPAGLVNMQDPETGRMQVLDTSSRSVRKRYEAAARKRRDDIRETFRQIKMDALFLSTDQPVADDIHRLFRKRRIRARRG